MELSANDTSFLTGARINSTHSNDGSEISEYESEPPKPPILRSRDGLVEDVLNHGGGISDQSGSLSQILGKGSNRISEESSSSCVRGGDILREEDRGRPAEGSQLKVIAMNGELWKNTPCRQIQFGSLTLRIDPSCDDG